MPDSSTDEWGNDAARDPNVALDPATERHDTLVSYFKDSGGDDEFSHRMARNIMRDQKSNADYIRMATNWNEKRLAARDAPNAIVAAPGLPDLRSLTGPSGPLPQELLDAGLHEPTGEDPFHGPARNKATVAAPSASDKDVNLDGKRGSPHARGIIPMLVASGPELQPPTVAAVEQPPHPALPPGFAEGYESAIAAPRPGTGAPVARRKMDLAQPFHTALDPFEEAAFQSWVGTHGVPFDPGPKSDYDMRGFWLAHSNHDPRAVTELNPADKQMHFPDTWKTPYHKTFSNESIYAPKDAPHWEGDKLIDKHGNVVADETPGGA